jgi:DNA-directed RNA polymerase subunit L
VDEMDRKEMIKKLGEHLGVEPRYLGVPTFNYEIKTDQEVYIIDRLGIITKSNGETITEDEILSQQETEEEQDLILTDETESDETFHQDSDSLQVKIEFEDHTATSLKNIINMIYSKQHLIMMSFQTEEHFMDDDFIQELNKEEINDLEELKASIEKLGRDKCPGFQINFEQETFGFYLHGSSLSPERDKAFKIYVFLFQNMVRH